MGLAGRNLGRQSPPNEPTEWLEFQTISGAALDRAAQVAMRVAVEGALDLVKDGLMNLASQAASGSPTIVDPETQYDKATLIDVGVVAWSYPEPCDSESKLRLDATTRDWAAHIVYTQNVRPEGKELSSVLNSNRVVSLPS